MQSSLLLPVHIYLFSSCNCVSLIVFPTTYQTEHLSLTLSIKVVDSLEEAILFINKFGSHHTDCIVTESAERADIFFKQVDSSGVYWNASTRFADGFRYGFGAEGEFYH